MKKAKPLFANYNYEFTKNEKKVLTAFCKQVLKQTEGNQSLYQETKAFNSILEKLNSDSDTVKLTKDEKLRLKGTLSNNLTHLRKEIKKKNFLIRWFYKSLLTQYEMLYDNHFKD